MLHLYRVLCNEAGVGAAGGSGLRQDVVEDREVVEHAAREHEEMPDRVGVGQPAPEIEDHADGIGKAARRKSEGPAKADEREGRVGTGDEKKDGRVIEGPEETLQSRCPVPW